MKPGRTRCSGWQQEPLVTRFGFTVTDSVMIGEGNQRGTFQLGSRVSVWSTMPATDVPAAIKGLVHRYCS